MKAVVFSLGCKVNQSECDSLASALIARGYDVSSELVPADLYIVNTCAVTGEAEKKSRQMHARIRALAPKAKIIYTGCASEHSPRSFLEKDGENVVTGVFGKNEILNLLGKKGAFVCPQNTEYEELPAISASRTRVDVKVQDGCNRFCSYCLIPYLRGRSRSRSTASVRDEIMNLNASEVVLNGIDLSSYRDGDTDLAGLLYSLKDVKTRIRLGSLEARVVNKRFLDACHSLYDFAPHFHLSLQSGSDAVLRAMNRHYTAEEYSMKVNLIRSVFPLAAITTDVIAGFPTETDENAKETEAFIKKVGFSDIHPFPYSPRSGTPAAKMPQVAPSVKKARTAALIKLKECCRAAFMKQNENTEQDVIVEETVGDYSVGTTGNYLRVFVLGALPVGARVRVKIKSPIFGGVEGEIIKP